MKVTSSEAFKLVRQLNNEMDMLRGMEQERKTFTASTEEKVEDVRPEYDFVQTQEKMDALERRLRKIKHAINQFNTTTVLEDYGITIDEALVYLPQLNVRVDKLNMMRMAQVKARKNAYAYGRKDNVIEFEYANYSIKEAEAAYQKYFMELTGLQTALDKANNTQEFEIPDEM